jgi:plastocyanin
MKLGALAAAAVAAAVACPFAAGARPRGAEVAVQFDAYGPSQLDVVPGQAVTWTNVSLRTHTVTSDTGLFDSGNVRAGERFVFQFDRPGTYQYHCTIHSNITGEIDVRRVILGPLPTAAVPAGTPVEFTGRAAAAGRVVSIQRRVGAGPFTTIAQTDPRPDGTWSVMVDAQETGDYRAAAGSDVSQTRRLLVGVRRVLVRATQKGVGISVTPSAPYARILVEVYLRERFGWWPIYHRRLDYVSEAQVRIRRPARVRVVLVDNDGWTPIATSRVLRLRRS